MVKMTYRAARVNAGYTIAEACKLLGISRITLGHYENGKTFPRMDVIQRMAETYGIPIEMLKTE